jgi:hypothetical protein
MNKVKNITYYNDNLLVYTNRWYRKEPDATGNWTTVGPVGYNSGTGDHTIYGDYLILAMGGKKAKKVDSSWYVTDVSADATPSKSTICHTHQYRLWLNDEDNKMHLHGSKILNPFDSDSYSANQDHVKINLTKLINEEDEIIGVRTLTNSIMAIFLKKHIVLYDAPSDYNSIKLIQIINVGALGNNSIINWGSDILFASLDGIRSLTSSIKQQEIDLNNLTNNISNRYRGLVRKNIDNLSEVSLGYNLTKNHLYVSFPYSNGETLIYSTESQQFIGTAKFHTQPYSWFQKIDQTGIYMGGGDNYIYKFEDEDYHNMDDNQYNIPFKVSYPYISEDIMVNKVLKDMFIFTESTKNASLKIRFWHGLKEDSKHSNEIIFTVTGSDPYWRSGKWREPRFRECSAFDLSQISSFTGRGNLFCLDIEKVTEDARIKLLDNFAKIYYEGEN